ncbi:MAG: LLM class flavin-dependent oxidoreductase [Micromonosporaceae bacterium]
MEAAGGVGYVEPELRAMGVSLADRGARTDEYLAAMRTLWTEPAPSFQGRFVSYSGVFQRPQPVQRPHPPIVVGGHSPAAYRRAITTGNGWYGVYLDVEQAAEALAGLRRAAAGCDRPSSLGELEITITPPGPVDRETARRYAGLGVHRLVIQSPNADGSGTEELIRTAGDTLIGRLRRPTAGRGARQLMPFVLRDISDLTPLGASADAIQKATQSGFPSGTSLARPGRVHGPFGWLAVRYFRWE